MTKISRGRRPLSDAMSSKILIFRKRQTFNVGGISRIGSDAAIESRRGKMTAAPPICHILKAGSRLRLTLVASGICEIKLT